MSKVAFMPSFFKSSIAAIFATVVDFGTLIFATEILGIYYVISTGIGAAVGAIVSFIINRQWAFQSTEESIQIQIWKYIIASLIILAFNVYGVYFFTESIDLEYKISKIVVALLVGIFVSFPLFRYIVFK